MIAKIVSSTDNRFVGELIDSDDRPIVLGEDFAFYPDKVIPLPDGVRLASSNYVIDAQEI